MKTAELEDHLKKGEEMQQNLTEKIKKLEQSLNEELDNERRLEMGRTQVKRRLDRERGVVEKLLRKIGELKNERLHNKEMTDEMKRDARRKEANLNKELAVTQAKVKEIEENLKNVDKARLSRNNVHACESDFAPLRNDPAARPRSPRILPASSPAQLSPAQPS